MARGEVNLADYLYAFKEGKVEDKYLVVNVSGLANIVLLFKQDAVRLKT